MVAAPVLKNSLREFDQAREDALVPSDSFFLTYGTNDLLPAWGYRTRDLALRQYWYASHNTLVQGAFSGLIRKVVGTGWEIKGGRNLTRRFQDMLQDAEFGEGWRTFLMKVLTDYLTQDFGAVIEIIGAGESDKPLRGPVLGIAHLDSLRCLATNDPEYPVVYKNITTNKSPEVKYHRLHRSRVVRLVDMASPDELFHGNGLCALSRLISVANAQILIGKYQNEKLSDLPPLGFMTLQNVKPGDWENAFAMYERGRQAEGEQVYRQIFRMQTQDPGAPIKVDFISFSQLPDSFNYREYMEVHVNMLALALGVDPQDIWPLTGAPLGTGTQSLVLHAKGQSKGFGDILTSLERIFNQAILPEALEFTFKYRDPMSDKEEAETANVWVGVANSAPLSDDEKRMLLAAKVPALADVLFDEAGNIRLSDVDPQPIDEATIADDNATLQAQDEGATPAADATTATDSIPVIERGFATVGGQRDLGGGNAGVSEKAIQSTRLDFEGVVADTITSALNRSIPNRTRFGIVMRAHITKYGRAAMLDGLKDGGVEVEALEDEDAATFAKLVSENSAYVSNLSASLFTNPPPTLDPEQRAGMWANKTLDAFYNAGLVSADGNSMYEFTGTDGEESCDTCSRLKGQVHRLKDWTNKRLRPGIDTDNFICGGFQCEHKLTKTTRRASGRF